MRTGLTQLLRQQEFHLFLFGLLFILIDWPFLSVAAANGSPAIFAYLFLLWSFFILLLFLLQRTFHDTTSDNDRDPGGV